MRWSSCYGYWYSHDSLLYISGREEEMCHLPSFYGCTLISRFNSIPGKLLETVKSKEKRRQQKINRKKENHKIKVADEMRRVTTTNIVRVDETEKEVIKRFLIEIPCLRYTKKFRGSFKNTFYLSLMIENVSHIFTLVFLRRENEVKLWLWRNFGGNVIWISQKNILELITGWKLWMMVEIITRVHHHKKLKLTRQYFTLEQFYVWVILIQIFNQRLLFFITNDYYFCRCKKINCC